MRHRNSGTRAHKPRSAEAALKLIGDQFARQPASETIPQFFARLMKAYETCRSALSSLQKLHMLPHPDTLTRLVANRARVEYSKEVLRFCKNSDIADTDSSMDDTADLYMKAAARTVRAFPVLQQAIEAANAQKRKRKPRPAPEEGTGGARRGKGDKGGKGAPAPAPPRTPQAAPNLQPPLRTPLPI